MHVAAHASQRAYIFYLGLIYLRTFKSWGYPGEYLLGNHYSGVSGLLVTERYLHFENTLDIFGKHSEAVGHCI